MKENKKLIRYILIGVTFAVLLYWAVSHFGELAGVARAGLRIVQPFIVGLCLAVIINVLLRKLEKLWAKIFKKHPDSKAKRPVCLALSLLVGLAAIALVLFIIVPEILETITSMVESLPQYAARVQGWWSGLAEFLQRWSIEIPALQINTDKLVKTLGDYFASHGTWLVGQTVSITASIFAGLMQTIVSVIFSIYVLTQKETLGSQIKRLLAVTMPQKKRDKLYYFTELCNEAFSNFVTGQLIEAVIIGFLCFLGMLVLRLPFAPVVSVLVGATALIPVLGAYIGAAGGALLILLDSPLKALIFIVFLVILQNLEGNLIYPKVVGEAVGLPGIWVLVAVTVGGGLFGIPGMLVSVPLCSVLYTLLGEYVRSHKPKE